MTYAVLSLIFLGLAVVLAAVAVLIGHRRPRLRAVGQCMAVLLLLTAIFDTVMIGVGFFTYTDAHLLGARIGLAPVEDFAYPIAGAVLLPSIWVALRARRDSRASRSEADR